MNLHPPMHLNEVEDQLYSVFVAGGGLGLAYLGYKLLGCTYVSALLMMFLSPCL